MDEDDVFQDARNNGELAAGELRNPRAIRERCGQLLARARAGRSAWFELDEGPLSGPAGLAEQIALAWGVPRRAHAGHPHFGPTALAAQPLHQSTRVPSWWRLLEAGGQDRRGQLLSRVGALPPGQQSHALLDLATVGVLLDAAGSALGPVPGADPLAGWHYSESATGLRLAGREGLAVACFHAFCAGLFSSRADRPCQADARGLRALLTDHLSMALQVSARNPLPGLASRAIALRRLGERLAAEPEVFDEEGRPGAIIDLLEIPYGLGLPYTADVGAADLLAQVLISLSGLGPAGGEVGGWPLGDCWRHPAVWGPAASDGWLPLHTLAQRLTLALLEAFAASGVQVLGLEALTAPADAWHGGLLLARGVLRPRPLPAGARPWRLDDEPVVEWRGLTLALLEDLGTHVRQRLGLEAAQLPWARLDLRALLATGTGATDAAQEQAPALRSAPEMAQQWSPAAGAAPGLCLATGEGPLL